MFNESRIDLYDYISGIFNSVSENIYKMKIPQELTDSDTTEGFIVVYLGDIYDDSEFLKEAYGDVRVVVSAYVPLKSRGRLNKELYKAFESGINDALGNEILNGTNEHYTIQDDGILSMDDIEDNNANNSYSVYTKTFIVTVH